MHKKSIGFNWGPCAVSTGYWTGVRMSTLLKMAGVRTGEGSAAAYVSFRGPKGELPKGDDGSYGESCAHAAFSPPAAGLCWWPSL
jgi:DMSO/TMAO reductase YedYZ molybdopterin-dependent catalytic subunit